MPTLVDIVGSEATDENDGSITIFGGDESTVFDQNEIYNSSQSHNKSSGNNNLNKAKDTVVRSKRRKSVTFDESSFVLSSLRRQGKGSRRDTMNSDVSLSLLSCDNTPVKEKSILSTSMLSTKSINCHSYDQNKEGVIETPRGKMDQERNRPRRDEYLAHHQLYVKTVISKFESKFPEKLRDYRKMTVEEKEKEQQKVMTLLNRLKVSKSDNGGSSRTADPSFACDTSFRSPAENSRILDESISPSFSPCPIEPHNNNSAVDLTRSFVAENGEEHSAVQQNESQTICEKSELLLSMEDSVTLSGKTNNHGDQNMDLDHNIEPSSAIVANDVAVPSNNKDSDNASDCSMEIVRQAAAEESYRHDDRNSPCLTPEGSKISENCSKKREATTSGKRGADLRRRRHDDNEHELSENLGRLSISPSLSSTPKDLFITSQSPISPRLTYPSPDYNNSNDDDNGENYGDRISLGRDSDDHSETTFQESRRDSRITVNSLLTNTPPSTYQSEKEKCRAFREVPVNVGLKKGATFHLEKIAVKRTELISSKSVTSKTHRSTHRRRLVNFPDPLVRYGSRKRRALKEMYSWTRHAERDYEDGTCSTPAAGAFFSLSEEQIIDLNLKLLLSDYAEKPEESTHQRSQSSSLLKGNTLIVLRAKEDSANWENALREGSGCSVLNHSSLPLSERIRASTSEKACCYDVVLTTYDAMKSPDVAIPVTTDGHAILNKSNNDGGWHASRSSSQEEIKTQRQTKQLSVLHRIEFKRIIFLDVLGRKSYLAKAGTARAAASVAMSSSSSRLAFFRKTEADGSNALLGLRKSDKRAFQSVSSVLHLKDNFNKSHISDSSDDEERVDPLEDIAMDLKDLMY